MHKRNQKNKQMTYKETAHGCIVLVTSSDPKVKIKILKSKLKTRKTRNNDQSSGVLGWLDR